MHEIAHLFQEEGQMLIKMGAIADEEALIKIRVYSNVFEQTTENNSSFSADEKVQALFASAYDKYDSGDALSTGEIIAQIASYILA